MERSPWHAAGTVELWNPATAKQSAPRGRRRNPVTTVAFDPTGQRLVTAGLGEGTVKLWFTATPSTARPSLGIDQGATTSAAFDAAATI